MWVKGLKRNLTREGYSDANKHIALGNCKLKRGNASAHLLEWVESRTLMALQTSADVEQQELRHRLRECKVAQPPWKTG